MGQTKRIIGGKVVTPDRVIDNGVVWINDGRILDVESASFIPDKSYDIDASGLWVMPGIIDSHSDAIENEIQPRPNSHFPLEIALHELEKRLISCGITTMYHSVSIFHRDAQDWLRKNETVKNLVKDIKRLSNDGSLIRNKVHLRFEINNVEAVSIVEELITEHYIDELSFMDHTPGQGQYRNLENHKRMMKGLYKMTEEEIENRLQRLSNLSTVAPETLEYLGRLGIANGIPIASHDDDSLEKLMLVKDWGTSICEFPVELTVVSKAKEMGFFTVMGAPNMFMGRSTSDNLSAKDAFSAEALDMLCSDYYPPSMLYSVFGLYAMGYHMHDVVKMVSLNPAIALGLSKDLGSIEPSKYADIILVGMTRGLPRVEKVLVEGEILFEMNHACAPMDEIIERKIQV
jgi:alpha-D-ribose 1-methylphosphonate 5-triphosphate diphosphatase